MKYTNEAIINLPREKVVELFDNPDNLRHWQPGLISFEHISGTPGQPGAKSRIRYKMGKREVEMIETVKVRDFPDEFTGTYEIKGAFNEIRNKFISMAPDKTKFFAETEFIFSNFMMKVMAFLMPGAFKKQSQKFMDQFKEFAEREGSK